MCGNYSSWWNEPPSMSKRYKKIVREKIKKQKNTINIRQSHEEVDGSKLDNTKFLRA